MRTWLQAAMKGQGATRRPNTRVRSYVIVAGAFESTAGCHRFLSSFYVVDALHCPPLQCPEAHELFETHSDWLGSPQNPAEHNPVAHWLGAMHTDWFGSPQSPLEQTPVAHWLAELQTDPLGSPQMNPVQIPDAH
jgi:hypothetical protein